MCLINRGWRTQHVPSVLEVLDHSRTTLDKRFGNDPETHVRLLDVLAGAFSGMNRPDIALPLVLQLKSIVTARHGADDPRVIEARVNMAQLYKDLRSYDEARDMFMALLPEARQKYGVTSDNYASTLSDTFYLNLKTGRLDEAERVLAMSKAALPGFPEGGRTRPRYAHDDALLRSARGRYAESRELFGVSAQTKDPAL